MRRFIAKCLSVSIFCIALGATANIPAEVNYAKDTKAVRAGVCSVLSRNLSSNRATVVSKSVEKTSTSSIQDLVDEKLLSKDKEGNLTICGYTHLGIIQVEGNLNIRKTPSKEGRIIGKITNHSGCEILKKKGEWIKIKSGNAKGWVSKEYLVTGTKAYRLANKYARHVAKANTDHLRVRAKASTNARIITKIAEGELLEIDKVLDDWIKVEINGDSGYISDEYADVSYQLDSAVTLKEIRSGEGGSSDVRMSLVQYALQFVGGRYVWGGTNLSTGVDCSGFTMQIFAKYGIGLPHYSGAQANCGARISVSEAKPGDLFFYGSGRSIGHVAIYIGNGQIVHAASARTGIIVGNAFYRNPICAVRLINN
ncbi:MAG: peptidoglycan endopeptidase [Lachnospiraceae bacterium]|jgi:cell wall-associated NlpC family hydrolase|nr:peptidoglycan endopeptidase [Lachnospiraceae bacterium]